MMNEQSPELFEGGEQEQAGSGNGTLQSERKDAEASRREFLRKAAAGVAIGGAAALGGATVAARSGSGEPASGRRLAMVIDLRRCYGCRACAVACKAEANVPLGAFRSYVSQVETDDGRHVARRFVPRLCNHCRDPACIKVCPVGATYKREDGPVLVHKDRCIGCRYCEVACPYGARNFRWHRVASQDGLDWPARVYGTVDKCDFCIHRVDNGMVPACVNTCPARARIFGDLNDPDSEVARLVATEPVAVLAPELGTEPSVFYIGLHEAAAEASMEAGPRVDPIRV